MEDSSSDLILTLPIRCNPQPRPRVTKTGTFDPNKQNKLAIALLARSSLHAYEKKGWRFPIMCSMAIAIEVVYKKPKRSTLDAPAGDVDNLAKTVLDALQGIVYTNDRKVKRLTIEKFYGEKDETRVQVRLLVPGKARADAQGEAVEPKQTGV